MVHRRTSGWDEDDVRVRPNPRGTRPRSKLRPMHEGATEAMVVTVDRGRFTCALAADGTLVHAVKARELGRKGVVVGDRVALTGDLSGNPDSPAWLVRREPRATVLRRTADDTDAIERVIVANADQLAIVVALADPEPRIGLIDRCVAAALDADLEPLLVLTKPDLASPDDLLSHYSGFDLRSVVVPQGDIARAAELLHDRTTVMVGHSGVGKSTLVNALVPGAERSTGSVNVVTGRGRHTSTSAMALPLEGGGWIIDTPGVRSFGLAHLSPERLLHAFEDLIPGTANCPRACSHDEADCALDAYVTSGAAGAAGEARLSGFRRLLRSRAA